MLEPTKPGHHYLNSQVLLQYSIILSINLRSCIKGLIQTYPF